MKPLIYLAVPYTHPDPNIREERFKIVNQVAGKMMKEGHLVFSPISHTHTIQQYTDLPHVWSFWCEQDSAILRHCDKLVVLQLPGWEESVGVTAEINLAKELNIPIEYALHT